jgi:nucleoside-diphosphate-sugar epimerase
MKILVAGASGVVGQRLCGLLIADGHSVSGTTRSTEKAALLDALGVTPLVVDVFDAAALSEAIMRAGPEVVIHQLTDLPDGLDPAQMADARIRNTRIRDEGTRNLIAAAVAAGAKRLIAQSIAFAYAPGPLPYNEASPLDSAATGVISLEAQVLNAPMVSVVLRYGKFYGQDTGFDVAPPGGPLHIDAAADAARLAVTRGLGVYNVAEDDGTLITARAMAELGFDPAFRLGGGN